MDGQQLECFSFIDNNIPLLDKFICNCVARKPINKADKEWIMNDLVVRYGVSSSKIYKDYLGRGLPYYKVGREYHFIPAQVKEWEIRIHKIPYGRNSYKELPAYTEYKNEMLHSLKIARKLKDKNLIRKIEKELQVHKINIIVDWRTSLMVVVGIVLLATLVALIYWFTYH